MSPRATDGEIKSRRRSSLRICVCLAKIKSGYFGPSRDDLSWEEEEEDEALGSTPWP